MHGLCLRGCVCVAVSAWLCLRGCGCVAVSAWLRLRGCGCVVTPPQMFPPGTVPPGMPPTSMNPMAAATAHAKRMMPPDFAPPYGPWSVPMSTAARAPARLSVFARSLLLALSPVFVHNVGSLGCQLCVCVPPCVQCAYNFDPASVRVACALALL